MTSQAALLPVRRVAAGMTTPQWLGLGIMLALAIVVGVAGMADLPPDEHEVLVLRTATEMHARGDWVVPYFNGEPRLNKPPMSYWLTAAVAEFAGADGAIRPWHGRVPSLAAGFGMLTLLIVLGGRLYSPRAALSAGALFVTSSAFYTYSHDARPDFLYAFFCSAGVLCGALAQLDIARRQRLAVYAMWVAYALATLTKGPQAPLMLLVAGFVFRHMRGTPWRTFAPPGAVVLALALVVPWWLALRYSLATEVLEHSQLSGSLLKPSLGHLLNGYYFYRPLQLLLPWLPLVPVAWVLAARSGPDYRGANGYLALCVLCLVIGFSLGGQQRYFYLLPGLLPMFLLAGHGIDRVLDLATRPTLALWLTQGAVIIAALAWLFAGFNSIWLLGPVLTLAGGVGFFAGARDDLRPVGLFTACVVMVALVYVMPQAVGQLWSADRRNKAELAEMTAQLVDREAPLVAYRLTPEVYVYATGRSIARRNDPGQVRQIARSASKRAVFVLTETRYVTDLSADFEVEPLHLMPEGAGDRAGLYHLKLSSHE